MSAAYRIAVVALGLGLIAGSSFACGGDDDDDDDPDPTATTASQPTAPPDDTPANGDDDDDDDDNGNVDEGEAPIFEDGPWTGGEIEVLVTTTQERTITGTLLDRSSSDGPTTRLIYAKGVDTLNLSISRQYEAFAVSVYVEEDGFNAGSAFEYPCNVTYTETSETRIAGTFRCENGKVESFAHRSEGAATLEGTFTATR